MANTPYHTYPHTTFVDVDDEAEAAFTFAAPAFETETESEPAFAPQLIAGSSFDADDDDQSMYTPSLPSYRHAIGVFTTQPTFPCFADMNCFEAAPLPRFVVDADMQALHRNTKPKAAMKPTYSPASPSSYAQTIEVPQKLASVFDAVHPSFTSVAAPTKIMDVLQTALASLRCEVEVVNAWTLRVSALIVAEELRFDVRIARLGGGSKYEIEFVQQMGDAARFNDLHECIRARCGEIDDEACLAMLSTELDAWMDEDKEVTGRRFAIKTQEALDLLHDLACEHLDVETLYEVAKTVKNHCRHRRNRALFVQTERKQFLQGLRWMLADNNEITRYALFILQQYAKDPEVCSQLLATPFERSAFALLLDDVIARNSDEELMSKPRFGARSLTSTVKSLRQTALFA